MRAIKGKTLSADRRTKMIGKVAREATSKAVDHSRHFGVKTSIIAIVAEIIGTDYHPLAESVRCDFRSMCSGRLTSSKKRGTLISALFIIMQCFATKARAERKREVQPRRTHRISQKTTTTKEIHTHTHWAALKIPIPFNHCNALFIILISMETPLHGARHSTILCSMYELALRGVAAATASTANNNNWRSLKKTSQTPSSPCLWH